MDYKDIIYIVTLLVFYAFTFLTYAAVGNTVQGNKINKVGDFLHPFAKGYPQRSKLGYKRDYFFPVYYFAFFVFVIASFSKAMSLRGTFRSWIDRLIGVNPEEEQGPPAISPSASSYSSNASTSQVQSASGTSLTGKSKSKQRIGIPQSGSKKREKVPHVMRSSVVDPEKQIIPPLPRLSIREDTAEKLNRVLAKLESIDLKPEDSSERLERTTPVGKRKND